MINSKFFSILRCPLSGQKLKYGTIEMLDNPNMSVNYILESEDGKYAYDVINSIPRFVLKSNYADNFGMQWNMFAKTQLDSFSGIPISEDRFWLATGWSPSMLKDKLILDVGCGSGRFAEVALKAGAYVVALDYSSAVDACYQNLSHYPKLLVVQGDIYHLPFKDDAFDFIYSLGVLQHTPDVKKAFFALPPKIKLGGHLCVDYYWKRFQTMMNLKYLVRPITTRIDQRKLLNFLQSYIPIVFPVSSFFGRIPILGKILQRFILIVDYTNIYPLNNKQLKEWALLDTFDMLAPKYDNPQKITDVKKWMNESCFEDVQAFHSGHLVVQGIKKTIHQ
jgi:SAM-dependent methyltransferase